MWNSYRPTSARGPIAVAVVFDSEAAFESKAAHLEDAEALRPVVEAYAAAAKGFGGISLEPTSVTISGANAAVTYDVYFGTTEQYGDQQGTAEDRTGTWVVTRDEFWGFMSSACVPCPT